MKAPTIVLAFTVVSTLWGCNKPQQKKESTADSTQVATSKDSDASIPPFDKALVDTTLLKTTNSSLAFEPIPPYESTLAHSPEKQFGNNIDLQVYTLFEATINGTEIFHPSLGTLYHLPKEDQTHVIQDIPKPNAPYFQLNTDNRTRVLRALGIAPTDSLYLYLHSFDSVLILPVSETPLSVFEHPHYYDRSRIELFDYIIGFELTGEVKTIIDQSGAWLCVGPQNPFVTGKRISLRFEEMPASEFPNYPVTPQDSAWLLAIDSAQELYYQYTSGQFVYYLKDLYQVLPSRTPSLTFRQIIVQDRTTEVLYYHRVFWGGEAQWIRPASEVGNDGIQQPTTFLSGKIFKDYPPIMYGFVAVQYSCPPLDFMGYPRQFTHLECDNRW